MENEPASLLAVSLEKTLNGMPPIFMWQVGGGAKKSTRRGGSSLPVDSKTEPERTRSVYTSSCIMRRTHSSNAEEEEPFRQVMENLKDCLFPPDDAKEVPFL